MMLFLAKLNTPTAILKYVVHVARSRYVMLYFLGTWVAGGLGLFTALVDAASVNSASAVSTAQQGSLLGQLYQDYGVLNVEDYGELALGGHQLIIGPL
jgi:hypothetical protein